MKLYTIPISPNCRRCVATAKHLGLDVEVVVADMMGGELKSEAFLQQNPNGRVPLLVDGDFKLWESNAINQYLAEKCSPTDFFSPDIATRAHIVKWQFWESLHFNKAVGGICWETIAKPVMNLGQPDEDAIRTATEAFHPFASVLDDQLDEKTFILGDSVTLADFSVGSHSALVLHPQSRVPLDDYPNIKRWFQALESVPAWADTAPSF